MQPAQCAIGAVRAPRQDRLALQAMGACPLGIARSDEYPQPSPCAAPASMSLILSLRIAVSGIQPQVREVACQDHARIGFAPRMVATVLVDAVHRVIGNRHAL